MTTTKDLQPIADFFTDTVDLASFRDQLKDMLRDYTFDRLLDQYSGKHEAEVYWTMEGFIDALDRCTAQ